MKLAQLLQHLDITENVFIKYADLEITDLSLDSRKITKGSLFLAIVGADLDARKFITQAINAGASAVFAQAPYIPDPTVLVPIIVIADLPSKLGEIASFFYGAPSSQLHLIGVTGTNGKSTTCHYIAEILRNLGEQCATIGTLGVATTSTNYQNLDNTTPDPILLQQILANMTAAEIPNIAMEVSSHALVQNRVKATKFHTAIFTNLTQDHLDYHGNMHNYWQAKLKLFLEYAPSNIIVNLDDPYGIQLLEILPGSAKIIGYSVAPVQIKAKNLQLLCADNTNYSEQGIQSLLTGDFGQALVNLPVLGAFNLSNMLAAIAACLIKGYSLQQIAHITQQIINIPGRMQLASGTNTPMTVVDYAHTPDALTKVLASLKPYCYGKLWCVFGCGGQRDRQKRPLMLAAALQYSDVVVVTTDNPRAEDPQQIIADIISNNKAAANIMIKIARQDAIEFALKQAEPNDVILIAGKGHENYQIIGDQKLEFSDMAVVQNYFKSI